MTVSRNYEPGTLNVDQLAAAVQHLLLLEKAPSQQRTEITACSDGSPQETSLGALTRPSCNLLFM
jgi:hypothetical protein